MARNILVVEDDNNISNLIKMYLDKEGFDVRIAADGGKAVEEFKEKEPDLVLLDVMLPVLDGWGVCAKIRETSKCPIIMLTAKGEVNDRIHGLEMGADDYVVKPFEMKELLARINAVLRRMLEVSQLQSRDLTRTKAPFDVCESMRRVLISMEKKITDRGLDVDADIPDSGIMVLGDNDLITQVIYNLLENAAKFARKGSALYLGVTTLNGKALISVRNEGDTIPAEEIPLLFERFHKSDKSRSEDKDGVGLGLYVVKTILDQHKEHIAVTSENGLTTFTFSVTLAGGQTAQ